MAAYDMGQFLGVVILVALLAWLLRNSRRRAEQRRASLLPPMTAHQLIAEVQAAAAKEAERDPDPSELDRELREIYERLGHPEAFREAKEKVTGLADELAERDGMSPGRALRAAYERSLAEHREYLAARRSASPAVSL
jgi:hypothetical protein